jgi:hypothetical protein
MENIMIQVIKIASAVLLSTASFAVSAQVSDAVKAPSGKEAMTLKGVGVLNYECKSADGKAAWSFVPDAKLTDKAGKEVGKYYGGPTWELMDGSKITGKQLATAPGAAGAIPLQLVETTPAMGKGMLEGVVYIQRLNTVGGVAPSEPCDASSVGNKRAVPYSADYVFFSR